MSEAIDELRKNIAMYTDTPKHVDNILDLIKEAGYRLVPDLPKDTVEAIAKRMYDSLGNAHLTWDTCAVRGQYRTLARSIPSLVYPVDLPVLTDEQVKEWAVKNKNIKSEHIIGEMPTLWHREAQRDADQRRIYETV